MNPKKIIFAEDSLDIAKLVSYRLQKQGFEVVHFSTGEGVTEAVFSLKPDLVLLDIMMPMKDGIQILQEIRKLDKKLPVILFSAKSNESSVMEGFSYGASEFISKPFSTNELLIRINKLLKIEPS